MSDKKKQELIEKASGWALAIFAYGTALFYFAKHVLDLTGDDLDAYVATLSAGATLFAGFIAIYLFNDWREQKRFEINKEYSEKTLDLLNEVNNHINADYYNHILIKSSIEEYLVINIPNDQINITEILYKLKPQFETLTLILKDSDSKKILDEFEEAILHIYAYIKELNTVYKEYLDSLPPKYLNNKYNYIRRNQDNCNGFTSFKIKNYLAKINEDLEITDIDHINKKTIVIKNSYENFKKIYDEKYNKMIDFLIEKIRL